MEDNLNQVVVTADNYKNMKSAITYLAHLKYILLYVKEHFFVDIEFKIDNFAPQLKSDLEHCQQKYLSLIETSKCLEFARDKEGTLQINSILYSPFKAVEDEVDRQDDANDDNDEGVDSDSPFLENLDEIIDDADFTDCNESSQSSSLSNNNLQDKINELINENDDVVSEFEASTVRIDPEAMDTTAESTIDDSTIKDVVSDNVCQTVMFDQTTLSTPVSAPAGIRRTRSGRKSSTLTSATTTPATTSKRVKLESNNNTSAEVVGEESFNLEQGEQMLQIEYWCSFEGCRFNSKNLDLVKTHEEVRHIRQLLRCFQDGCDEVFDTQDDLDRHIKDVHSLILTTNVYTEVKCDIGGCDKTFANEFTLKKHLRMEHKDHYLTCRICDRKFKTRRYMTKHFRMYHPKAKKKELKKKGLADNNLKIKCTINECNQNFAKSSELKLHMRDYHNDIYLTCKFCDRVCKSRDNLTNHIWKMHQEGEFRCNHEGCDFVATVKKFLINHKKRCHPATKLCPIDGCGEIIQNQNYTKHLCSKHNIKNFSCSWPDCGKTFGDKNKLKDHVRIHLNFKRFKCKWPECGYASEQRYTVITHVRVCHFKLPRTKKKQLELNLPYDEEQNPSDYVEALREDICV